MLIFFLSYYFCCPFYPSLSRPFSLPHNPSTKEIDFSHCTAPTENVLYSSLVQQSVPAAVRRPACCLSEQNVLVLISPCKYLKCLGMPLYQEFNSPNVEEWGRGRKYFNLVWTPFIRHTGILPDIQWLSVQQPDIPQTLLVCVHLKLSFTQWFSNIFSTLSTPNCQCYARPE